MFNINYIKNYVNIVINFICYYLEIFPVISNYLDKFSWKVFIISKNSKARLGIIKTPHGKIYTPAFIFCATKATMRTTTMDYMKNNSTQIVLSNTYHLFLKGRDTIKNLGGLHKAIGWNGPMLTDSGGYQVFAMNHRSVSGDIKGNRNVSWKPSLEKITDKSAKFRCYYTNKLVELTPEESIEVQKDLGADLVVSFDECTSHTISKEDTEKSMNRSHLWEKRSLEHFNKINDGSQALYGIVQGGVYEDLRKKSCDFINNNNFFGIAVGGCLGDTPQKMHSIVNFCMDNLRKDRPVHLLGIGYLRDIFNGVRQGIDTFDCVHPSRVARHGYAYVKAQYLKSDSEKRTNNINLNRSKYINDNSILEDNCKCSTCRIGITKSYIHLLIKENELMAYTLITNHNVYFMNKLMDDIRLGILNNTLDRIENKYIVI